MQKHNAVDALIFKIINNAQAPTKGKKWESGLELEPHPQNYWGHMLAPLR